MYFIWTQTIVNNGFRLQATTPTSTECIWPHIRFPSSAVTVLASDFWNMRCWLTVLWAAGIAGDQGREGREDWGAGLRNWACYFKSSTQAPKLLCHRPLWIFHILVAVYLQISALGINSRLLTCFARWAVLSGTRGCGAAALCWSKAWGALALGLVTDPLERALLCSQTTLYNSTVWHWCYHEFWHSLCSACKRKPWEEPGLRRGSPGCSTSLALGILWNPLEATGNCSVSPLCWTLTVTLWGQWIVYYRLVHLVYLH